MVILGGEPGGAERMRRPTTPEEKPPSLEPCSSYTLSFLFLSPSPGPPILSSLQLRSNSASGMFELAQEWLSPGNDL